MIAPAIRGGRPSDQAFIATTFTEQLVRVKHKRSDADAIVDRVLDSDRVRILVACEPGAVDRIIGWLIYAPVPRVRAIVYAYVRLKHRRERVLAALAAQAWPDDTGKYVFALHGPTSRTIAKSHLAVELSLDELLS